MTAPCANGCIPSSPHVGCPVHGLEAKPGSCRDVTCGDCEGAGITGDGNLCPPPPEPALDGPTLRANIAIWQGQMDDLRAQLAAAQARVKELEEQRDTKQTLQAAQRDSFERQAKAATERAELAEQKAETQTRVSKDNAEIAVRETQRRMQAEATAEALRAALEDANGLCRSAYQVAQRAGLATGWQAFREQLEASLKRQHKALAAPPHGKDAGEEPALASAFAEVARLEAQRDALQAEVKSTNRECNGLIEAAHDADARAEVLKARLTEAEEFLWTLVDDPDWSNTSREAVCAFLKKPPEGTP
jgi:DNA repair exonuclease SbcCD ATPase subunit